VSSDEKIDSTSGETPADGLEAFVPQFITDRESDFNKIRQYIEDENFHEIKKIGHNWKGFSRPYGFAKLGVIGLEIEKTAIDEDKAATASLVDKAATYINSKK